MSCDGQNMNFNTLKENSELLVKLVDKYVKVHIIKDCSYVGFVHSIDPVSYSIILSIPQGNVYQIAIIPGQSILDVTEEELPADIKPPERKLIKNASTEDILKHKNKLLAWFKVNLLPVEELDDKIIVGNVSLVPPYGILDLYTENPIIAMQIKKIIEQMPDDFGT